MGYVAKTRSYKNLIITCLQQETDSWLENAANGLMGTQVSVRTKALWAQPLLSFTSDNTFVFVGQIVKSGQLKFVVDVLLGFKFSMIGKYE